MLKQLKYGCFDGLLVMASDVNTAKEKAAILNWSHENLHVTGANCSSGYPQASGQHYNKIHTTYHKVMLSGI